MKTYKTSELVKVGGYYARVTKSSIKIYESGAYVNGEWSDDAVNQDGLVANFSRKDVRKVLSILKQPSYQECYDVLQKEIDELQNKLATLENERDSLDDNETSVNDFTVSEKSNGSVQIGCTTVKRDLFDKLVKQIGA